MNAQVTADPLFFRAPPDPPLLQHHGGFLMELASIWPCRSAAFVWGGPAGAAFQPLPTQLIGFFAANQKLFNIFSVIHEIGSIYEDL